MVLGLYDVFANEASYVSTRADSRIRTAVLRVVHFKDTKKTQPKSRTVRMNFCCKFFVCDVNCFTTTLVDHYVAGLPAFGTNRRSCPSFIGDWSLSPPGMIRHRGLFCCLGCFLSFTTVSFRDHFFAFFDGVSEGWTSSGRSHRKEGAWCTR